MSHYEKVSDFITLISLQLFRLKTCFNRSWRMAKSSEACQDIQRGLLEQGLYDPDINRCKKWIFRNKNPT